MPEFINVQKKIEQSENITVELPYYFTDCEGRVNKIIDKYTMKVCFSYSENTKGVNYQRPYISSNHKEITEAEFTKIEIEAENYIVSRIKNK